MLRQAVSVAHRTWDREKHQMTDSTCVVSEREHWGRKTQEGHSL